MANKAWLGKDARDLVGAMREKVNQYGYEILIGGSVALNGGSANDLDLFFIPKNDTAPILPVEMLMWLSSKFGLGKTIVPAYSSHPAAVEAAQNAAKTPARQTFSHKIRFDLAGRKIDVFII